MNSLYRQDARQFDVCFGQRLDRLRTASLTASQRGAMSRTVGQRIRSHLLVAGLLVLSLAHQTDAATGDFDLTVQSALPLVREAYDFLHRNPELGKKEFKA